MPPNTSLKQLPVTLCNKQKSSNTFVNLWKLTETRRSFRKLHTVDELREFVDNNEISLIDYMISTIDEDVSTAAGRSRYVARGAEILSHVSDGVIFDNCVKLLALESLSTVREAVGKVDETMKTSGNLDEITKVCRKCLNFYESLKCSGSVVPVVSRCCALNDDGCGVRGEEVFVVAQSSFLDDGTVGEEKKTSAQKSAQKAFQPSMQPI
ncbi:hypothetical protein [Cutibacterium acnes]|uniref:hypothetical protein n=1 Tax=Cutibacterium acnes TaxID=1747 RepID=UPI001FB181BE|nr:hypothetical protein [Cutibacterium acnes]